MLGLVTHPYPGCQVLIVSVNDKNSLINTLLGISSVQLHGGGSRYAAGVGFSHKVLESITDIEGLSV